MVKVLLCFFKRMTAYGVRISDWSSDVCSSDLLLQIEARRDDLRFEEGAVAMILVERGARRLVLDRHQPAARRRREHGEIGIAAREPVGCGCAHHPVGDRTARIDKLLQFGEFGGAVRDRKSTRLNSSH